MSDKLISENICTHDPRSELYADLKMCDDDWQDAPPEGCGSCDNCFYRRHKLASTIAALQQQGEAVEANEDALAAAQANGAIGYVHSNGGQFYVEWFGGNQLPNFAEQFLYTHPPKPVVSDERESEMVKVWVSLCNEEGEPQAGGSIRFVTREWLGENTVSIPLWDEEQKEKGE